MPYLRAYVGQTRSAALIAELQSLSIAEMVVRGELPPRRHPWAYDNGAYRDWKAGAPFDERAFLGDLDWIQLHARIRPDFIVAPDIVAGGLESLRTSVSWLPRIAKRKLGAVYLAVQDGMPQADVAAALAEGFAGLFVGGTSAWKFATGEQWATTARTHGKRCHIARVSSLRRIRWAYNIGADSVDSCQPLRRVSELERFVRALNMPGLPFVGGLPA